MTELLRAIREDLTSRRMLPLLVLAVGLLAGAVAYAALGGKTSQSVASAPPRSNLPAVPGPSVSSTPADPNDAVAETTNGSSFQHGGHVHNPFKPLPSSESKSSGSGTSSSSGQQGTSAGAGTGGSVPGGGESSPSGAGEAPQGGVEPATQTVYEVSGKLQRLTSTGKPDGKPELLSKMAYLRAQPSSKKPLFAYVGVASGGNGALFLLLSPAIVHGPAHCLPGPANCEALYIKPSQAEELQYLEGNVVVSYELTLSKFEGVQAPAAAVLDLAARLVKAEGELMSKLGFSLPAGVHYSEETGLLLGVQEAIAAKAKAAKAKAAKTEAAKAEAANTTAAQANPATAK